MAISNLIGPMEQMALANHPIKSLYFMTVKVPQVYKSCHELDTFGFLLLLIIRILLILY